ncbi:hypothetical protein CF327_g3495 [Tilletia walkeri]|nr:hypothetical protein CF327_g3495 [Tilletia walkeri]
MTPPASTTFSLQSAIGTRSSTGSRSGSFGPQQDTASGHSPLSTIGNNSNNNSNNITPTATPAPAAPFGSSAGPSGLGSPSSASGKSILICLLRLDLHIEDNALFYYAHQSVAPPPHPLIKGLDTKPEEGELYSQSEFLLPLYVFDEREIELSGLPAYKRKGPEARTPHYGFWKTGGFRARFVAECVYDLRSRLLQHGSNLLIRFGIPEDVLENLVSAFQARGDHVEAVWMQKEMTEPEARVEDTIQKRMTAKGVPVRFVYSKTLVHPADLPFSINETPDVFTPFRKRVEALGANMVRPTLKVPRRFKPFLHDIPKTEDYSLDVTFEVDVNGEHTDLLERDEKRSGEISFNDILDYLLRPLNAPGQTRPFETQFHLQQRHPASAFPLRGGETSGLERLEWYFVRGSGSDSSRWGKQDAPPVARYKQTRNNLIGHAYSTKMSAFLAYGSISPRQIWEALDAHDLKFGSNQNTYWVRFELLWRDFFALIATKYGALLFELGGFELATDPRQAQKKTEGDWWKKWNPERDSGDHDVVRVLEGKTGIPFIDANITELRESGFMSNRGRQNVASFLSKDLSYDWRIGAEFFQSHLIDYDATSNYGNWQYVAGVGNDPRASRQFNIIKQSKTYDPEGEYIKLWVPELRGLTSPVIHHPWTHPREAAKFAGTYPNKPLIESDTWHKHYATPTASLRGGGGGTGGGVGGGMGRHSGAAWGAGGTGSGSSHGIPPSLSASGASSLSGLSSSPTSGRGLMGSGVIGGGGRGVGGIGSVGRGPSAALERAGALGSALAARNAAAAGNLVSGGPGLGVTGGVGPAGAAAVAASGATSDPLRVGSGGFGRGSSASTWFGRGAAASAAPGSGRQLSGSRPSSGAGTAVDYGASRSAVGRFGLGVSGASPAAVTPPAGGALQGTTPISPAGASNPFEGQQGVVAAGGAHSEDVIQALTGELRSLRTALDLVTSTLLQSQSQAPGARPIMAQQQQQHGNLSGRFSKDPVEAMAAGLSALNASSAMLGGTVSPASGLGGGVSALPPVGTPYPSTLSNSPVASRRPPYGPAAVAAASSSPSTSPLPSGGGYGGGGSYSYGFSPQLQQQPYQVSGGQGYGSSTGASTGSGPTAADREADEALERVRVAEEQGRELRDQIQQWEGRVKMLVDELRVGRGGQGQGGGGTNGNGLGVDEGYGGGGSAGGRNGMGPGARGGHGLGGAGGRCGRGP